MSNTDTSSSSYIATIQGQTILAGVRSKGGGYVTSASTTISAANITNAIQILENPPVPTLTPIIFSSIGTKLSGPGTGNYFTIPTGYSLITYTLVGGGGSGSAPTGGIPGGGGGGGAYTYGTVAVTPGWQLVGYLGNDVSIGSTTQILALTGPDDSVTLVSAAGGGVGTYGNMAHLDNAGVGTVSGGNGLGYSDLSFNILGGKGGISGSNGITGLTIYGGGGGGGGTRIGTATNGGSPGTSTAGGAGGPGYYNIIIT